MGPSYWCLSRGFTGLVHWHSQRPISDKLWPGVPADPRGLWRTWLLNGAATGEWFQVLVVSILCVSVAMSVGWNVKGLAGNLHWVFDSRQGAENSRSLVQLCVLCSHLPFFCCHFARQLLFYYQLPKYLFEACGPHSNCKWIMNLDCFLFHSN